MPLIVPSETGEASGAAGFCCAPIVTGSSDPPRELLPGNRVVQFLFSIANRDPHAHPNDIATRQPAPKPKMPRIIRPTSTPLSLLVTLANALRHTIALSHVRFLVEPMLARPAVFS